MERELNQEVIPYGSRFVQSMFSLVQWKGPGTNVYLTFDDGPHPTATPLVLNILKSYGLKATFFFLGRNVAKFPEIALEASREGHTVGNHSFDHALLLFRSSQFVREQIDRTTDQIVQATSVRPSLFRPPYGYFRPSSAIQAKRNGYQTIMWDVDSRDWTKRPTNSIHSLIRTRVSPGSIVLLHDNENSCGRIQEILTGTIDVLLPSFKLAPLTS